MSDATDRAAMERRLIEKSLRDDDFRQRLLSDPKAAMEQELGTLLPEQVRVVAVEETADTIFLVLPFHSTEAQEASKLSDQELETVAGGAPGGTSSGDTCSTAACWGFTCLDPSECG